jgi:hypothetical protein
MNKFEKKYRMQLGDLNRLFMEELEAMKYYDIHAKYGPSYPELYHWRQNDKKAWNWVKMDATPQGCNGLMQPCEVDL